MKKVQHLISKFLLLAAVGGTLVFAGPAPVSAAFDPLASGCDADPSAAICQNDAAKPNQLIRDIISTLLFVLGVISVIMIIVGGIRYALSGGDSGQTKSAKDTILYAVIGLVVALLSYAIVNFVIFRIG